MSESLLALQERPALPDTLSADLQPLPGHPAAYLGEGAAARLGSVIEALGGSRVLFVHTGGAGGLFAVGTTPVEP